MYILIGKSKSASFFFFCSYIRQFYMYTFPTYPSLHPSLPPSIPPSLHPYLPPSIPTSLSPTHAHTMRPISHQKTLKPCPSTKLKDTKEIAGRKEYTHAHTHACMYAHIHTHTHTHTCMRNSLRTQQSTENSFPRISCCKSRGECKCVYIPWCNIALSQRNWTNQNPNTHTYVRTYMYMHTYIWTTSKS